MIIRVSVYGSVYTKKLIDIKVRTLSITASKSAFLVKYRLTKFSICAIGYIFCHSLLNISLYDSSAEAKLAPIFVTNTAINVTLMQQVTIHFFYGVAVFALWTKNKFK